MRQKTTFKYTVDNIDLYLELVEDVASAITEGIDFYTDVANNVIFITFPSDRWHEISPRFEKILGGKYGED